MVAGPEARLVIADPLARLRRYLTVGLIAGLLGTAAWAWVRWRIAERQAADAAELAITPILRAKGWAPAEIRKPEIEGLPSGVRPLARLRGRIDYGPTLPTPPGATDPGSLVPRPDGKDAPGVLAWTLRADDLRGDAEADLIASPTRTWGRILWTCCARTPQGEVCRGPELARDVSIEVDKGVGPAARPRTLLGLDLGVVGREDGIGWEAGARWYPRAAAWSGRLGEVRLGAYARAGMVGSDPEIAAGGTVLLGIGR